MAVDINTIVVAGRLTRDAKTTQSTGGMTIMRFSIANNYSKKVGDSRNDGVNYYDCVMFGKKADSLFSYLHKGKQVAVIGELRQNRWEQDGKPQSKVEILISDIQLFGSQGQQMQSGSSETFDDDVPF